MNEEADVNEEEMMVVEMDLNTEEEEEEEEEELLDPIPDIHALFCHYNSLYFDGALGSCVVKWSSRRMTSCAGICCYLPGGGCEIHLSEPLLKFRKTTDLKNTLLHEMIHAFLWTQENNQDHSEHGPSFQAIMDAINSSDITDFQRPSAGYNITIYHDFHNEVDSYRVHQWICDSCGDWIKRSMNRKPSSSDCVEHKGKNKSCGSVFCHWHQHVMSCSGNYVKIAEPLGYKNKKKRSKVAEKLGEDKPQSLSPIIKDNTQRSQKPEGKKARSGNKSANPITNFFPVAGDKKSTISSSAFVDVSQIYVNCEESQPLISEGICPIMTPAAPKRTRISQSSKPSPSICAKRKRSEESKKEYTVVSKWLDYYESEEMHDDIKPLINKRTERRKKLKMMKYHLEKGSMFENMDEDLNGNTSCGELAKCEPFHDVSFAHTTNTSQCSHIQEEAKDGISHAHTGTPSKSLPIKNEAISKDTCFNTTEQTNEAGLNVDEISKQEPIRCLVKEVVDVTMVENIDHPLLRQACNSGCSTSVVEIQVRALEAVSHADLPVMDDIIDLSDD